MEQIAAQMKKQTVQHVIFAVLLVVAMLGSYWFYVQPLTESMSTVVVVSGQTSGDDGRTAFNQIKETLLQDQQFKSLQKFSVWPIAVDKLMPGNSAPFVIPPKPEVKP